MDDKKLEISVDSNTARGSYSNSFVLSVNPNEFILDFIFQNYQQNILQSRIVMTPQKAKELMSVLQKQFELSTSLETIPPSVN